MITQIEIAVQSTYGTNTGSGPIATALNWECATRLNKVGAFSFEMPLADSKRSLLVAKRYVRCYGIVNDTWAELGKPGIIEQIVRSIDGEGVPTGMIRVEGTNLFGELADILIHELDIIDTDTRIPDRMEYWDGTLGSFIPHGSGDHMEYCYDDNGETGCQVPSDDEDYLYVGDADPFDIVTLTMGVAYNTEGGTISVAYYNGSDWTSGTVLSDGTRIITGERGTWSQDGAIRWERQKDWAKNTVNGQNYYWLRFSFSEDLSANVTIFETTITQEIPTATALADWLGYTDVDTQTPINTLGWTFDADFYTATQSTVFLKLREVSAFKALTMIAEQAGENFRLGDGREIQWLQDDKTASGIVATNAIDATAGATATTNCWITSLRQSSDSYELVGRIYPKGGGRGSTRVDLSECTQSAAEGYTLSTANNYLQKDSVESDYGRPIERTKYWPDLVSPNAMGAIDVNISNALYDVTYQYLQRHCAPQTAYDIEIVKLDSAVPVGTTLQVAYWQTVDGSAIMDVGVDGTAVHLWVLESTQRVDNNGLRSVAMKIATTDAWPMSASAKMQEVVHQVLAMQSTDGPINAEQLTIATFQQFFEGATAHSQLTGVTEDQHHNAFAQLTGDSGTAVPEETNDGIAIASGTGLGTVGATNTITVNFDWSASTPGTIQCDASAAAGSSGYAARLDHQHAIVCAAPVAVDLAANAEGSATSFARSDHKHDFSEAITPTWTAKHIFRSMTTPQVEIGYDAAAYLSITQADGGSVTLATVSDGAGSMTLAPQGDVLFDPAGNDLLPVTGYDINFGSEQKKYLTGHFAELWVATLVAQETIATIGGRILVGPTTILTADLASAAISMWVKHNELAKDDTAYCESSGKVEFVRISPLTIGGVDVVNDWFLRNGDWRTYFTAGTKFTVAGSTGNNGEWTVESSSYSAPNTTIYVVEDITDATVDGHFLYWGEQGVGPYRYVIGRNIDGSGANDWYAGDAVFNTGNTGDGFIDLYSVHGIKAPTEYGPTIVINKRGSAAYNDWAPHAALGNLNGIAGIAATTWGLFVGDYADGDYLLYQAGGDPDFLIKAGGGAVSIDDDGITLAPSDAYALPAAITWKTSGTINVQIGAYKGSSTDVIIVGAGSGGAVAGDSATSIYISEGTASSYINFYLNINKAGRRYGFYNANIYIQEAVGIGVTPAAAGLSTGDVAIYGGLNVGTATGAGTGSGYFSNIVYAPHQLVTNYFHAPNSRWYQAGMTFDGNNVAVIAQGGHGILFGECWIDATRPTPAIDTVWMTIANGGNVTMEGTLTVNGNQTGATDHVFDEYDDIALLRKWRRGEALPFAVGDVLNRDRLLRDTIIQEHGHRLTADAERETIRAEIAGLQGRLDQMERRE